jgi:hypothetical protein
VRITLPQPNKPYLDPLPEVEIDLDNEDEGFVRFDTGNTTIKLSASALMRALIALGVKP